MKFIRHEHFGPTPMNIGRHESRSGYGVPFKRATPYTCEREMYHERIRLKKIAQRRRRRDNKGKVKTTRIATLNVGSMTGRGHEVVDCMERRKINIMCVQETKWKGSKASELENCFKLFYIGEDGRRNGMGNILNDVMKRGVLSVKRISDIIIWVKVALNGEIINIMSAYAPQTGCGENEKIQFCEENDEELRDIGYGEIVDRRGLQWPLWKE